MSDLRIDGESFSYTFSVTEDPADQNYFLVNVRSFIKEGLLENKEVQLDLGMGQELEILELLTATRISDVLSSGASYRRYTQGFTNSHPITLEQGPEKSVQFIFPTTVSIPLPSDYMNNSANGLLNNEKVLELAAQEGYELSSNVSTSDIAFDWTPGDKKMYVPSILIERDFREALLRERELDTGQSVEPALEDAQDEELQKRRKANNANLNEQAVLLFRLGKIMSINKDRREKSKLYDRFACLDYRKNGKADPANFSNHITSTTDLKDVFEDLRPIHLSAMIPKIRLFKQYTPQEMKKRKDGEPREVVEYEFEEFPDADILKSSLGTSTGVGISSFSWDFDGENMYSSEKMVSARMQLRAQSIDALNAKRRSPKQVEYRFCDIFYPPSVRKQDRDSKQLQVAKASRKKYEAKIVVEYGVEPNSDVWKNNSELLKAVQSLRLEMSLSMVKYDLDLQQDGSILVNLNFIGRVDASSNDPFYANILPKSAMIKRLGDATSLVATRNVKLQTIAEKENKINIATKALKPLNEALDANATGDPNAPEITQQVRDNAAALEKQVSLLSKELQDLNKTFKPNMTEKDYLETISREYDKIKLYQNIINGLFQRDSIDVLQVDPENILSEEKTRIIQDEKSLSLSMVGENPTTEDVVSADLSTSEFDQNKKSFIERMKSSVFAMYDNSEYYIRYFYFGDLLNVVLDNMLGESDDFQTDIRTLLGPIEIVQNAISSDTFASRLTFGTDGKIALYDSEGTRNVQIEKQFLEEQRLQVAQLAKAQRAGDIEQIREAEQDRQVSSIVVNLADVPISLNLFLQWFSEKIANQGVYSYSLKRFITDCINSLIISALQADSTKLILPKQKRRLVVTSFDAVADVATPDVFGFFHSGTDGLITNRKNSAMFVEDFLTNKAGKQSLPLFLSKNKPKSPDRFMADYLMVYAESTDYFRVFRTDADYKRDLREGIYHLHSGKDAGVVKEIKLSAETVPGYEEMMILEAMKGAEPSIKRIYRANVTLSGVPVFRPGHKVFVKAAAYGSDELLREFGLMGYYSVVRTSSNISAGQYETTLELVYQGSG